MDSTLEALNEVNRSLATIGSALDELRSDSGILRSEAVELKDIRVHWLQWRESWEKQIHYNEAHFLRSVAELNSSFEHKPMLADANFRESLRLQHNEFGATVERATKRNSTTTLGRYGAHSDGL